MERAELRSWLAASGCAESHGGFVFLRDPNWSAAERAEAERQMALAGRERGEIADGWLCIRTGGSGGGVRFARHDERTLAAAIRGFRAHFSLDRINAVNVLPSWHVSGLLAGLRCAATGGAHLPWDWARLERGDRPEPFASGHDWVISLVPTQLQRLIGSAAVVTWLRKFRLVFLGGGPAWPDLMDAAAAARLPLVLSYGLTETAAMVTALPPEEFLAGGRSSGTALPHARVAITPEGTVCIAGESVFHGYFPEHREAREFATEDLGRLDARGHLHLLGRRDALIITGGKKVQPGEVEVALRASGEFSDVAVLGAPDPEWGEIVVACYPAGTGTPDFARATVGLAPHQRPKRLIAISPWPRNAQGKLDRNALAAAVAGRR